MLNRAVRLCVRRFNRGLVLCAHTYRAADNLRILACAFATRALPFAKAQATWEAEAANSRGNFIDRNEPFRPRGKLPLTPQYVR